MGPNRGELYPAACALMQLGHAAEEFVQGHAIAIAIVASLPYLRRHAQINTCGSPRQGPAHVPGGVVFLEASLLKLGLSLYSRHVCKGREPSKSPFRPNLSVGHAVLIPLFQGADAQRVGLRIVGRA